MHTTPNRILPPPPPAWASWEELMGHALAEAAHAQQLGEVPVGAVVVTAEGALIGRGHNRVITGNDPTAHAEVVALRDAACALGNYRLGGCLLLVTLEPCIMCLGALVHARIAGVIYGAPDPRAGAVDSCMDGFAEPFLNHQPWHLGGIRAQDCALLLHNFFAERRGSAEEE